MSPNSTLSYTQGYYLAIKRNEVLLLVTIWAKLKNNIKSKRAFMEGLSVTEICHRNTVG